MSIKYSKEMKQRAFNNKNALVTVDYVGNKGGYEFQNQIPEDRAWLLVKIFHALNQGRENTLQECVAIAINNELNEIVPKLSSSTSD